MTSLDVAASDAFDRSYENAQRVAQIIVDTIVSDIEARYELGGGWFREPEVNRSRIREAWVDVIVESLLAQP